MNLLILIDKLRKWEGHCLQCPQCNHFDLSTGTFTLDDVEKLEEPCGIGRALILNILHELEKGIR